MIDVEKEVYTPIAKALRAAFPDVTVSGSYVHAPSSFPHVSIVEQDNFATREHLDSAQREKFATVMYQVDVYSDKADTKKTQCRKMMALIDEMMYAMNFTRLSLSPVPNMENASIYRLTARYRAETDGTTLYRR